MAPGHGAQFALGLREAALQGEAVGGADRELRLPRVQGGGAAEGDPRIGDALQGEAGLRQVAMEGRILRLDFNGPPNQADGLLGRAGLKGHDAGEMQGIRVPGLFNKCLFVKRFRLFQASCPVRLQGLLDQMLDQINVLVPGMAILMVPCLPSHEAAHK
ncbi:MAG: hypothetical protein A3I02_13255 [Betaproteobacteria bacterium RIFCSPLOWO2_02_FULL_67_26]|nr:MAG: hypothetical protein A3I02_13255 [Betaproteobacteria bacterium RIFCSPLOWO2_02_FULL_67_26]